MGNLSAFVVRRIPDVKSENRSSRRASTIHRAFNSEVETNREDFGSESTRLILNQAATALFLSFCDQIGSPRAPLAQKPAGSHFVLTVLSQSSSIGLRRRSTLGTRIDVSVYAVSREGRARMTSEDGVKVFN
jgi:hypothetical protein